MRRRLSAADLFALARSIENGRGDGYIEIYEEDDEFDSVMDISGEIRVSRRRRPHDVVIEMQVDPGWTRMIDAERRYQQFTAPKSAVIAGACRCPDARGCPVHNWQHTDFGGQETNPTIRTPPPPPPDYKAAIESFVSIVKVVVRAWSMDDNKIRFGLLELD